MPSRDKAIRELIEAFPEHSEAIERACAESSCFRSICEDFRECSEALIHWNKIISSEAGTRTEEYRELLRELEQEILGWLEVRKALLDPPGREGATEPEV